MTDGADLSRRGLVFLVVHQLALGSIGAAFADSGIGASGGQMLDLGGPHVELVSRAADTVLLFEVTDANRELMEMTGSRAEAVVQNGSAVVRLPLIINAPSWPTAKLPSALERGNTVQFRAVLPTGRTLSARFVVR